MCIRDSCYLGGMPGGGMAEVFGLRSEEIDALYDGQYNAMSFQGVRYRISELCDLVKTNTAAVLSTYEDDFYAGQPSLTVNRYGKGKAYYLAAKAEDAFYVDFYRLLAEENGVAPALDGRLPHGVTASLRKGSQDIVIVQNYNEKPAAVPLNASYTDLETGNVLSGTLELSKYLSLIHIYCQRARPGFPPSGGRSWQFPRCRTAPPPGRWPGFPRR